MSRLMLNVHQTAEDFSQVNPGLPLHGTSASTIQFAMYTSSSSEAVSNVLAQGQDYRHPKLNGSKYGL